MKKFVLFDIDFTLFDVQTFKDSNLKEYSVYKEVMQVLDETSKIAMLGIFSKGETEFQKTKLEKTGMAKFFKNEHMHIFVDKEANLTKIMDKYKDYKIFFIDDRLDLLYSAKKHLPEVFTIWVKRGWFAENQEPIVGFKADAEVENLSEVVRIVQLN
jgi:FMN phosphatase YigB (HAD superfamily)